MRTSLRTGSALALALAVASPATAQFSGLSSTCSSAAASLISSEFATCVNLLTLVSAISTSSGSIVSPINNWLGGACANTCSASTLQNATSTIENGCATDLQSGNALATGLVLLTSNYTEVKDFLCLGYSSNNTYCLTDLLYSVQNATNTNISASTFTSLLSGGVSSLSSIFSQVPASSLCTECSHAEISALSKLVPSSAASTANSTLSAVGSKCGSSFLDGQTPSGVTQLTSSSSSSGTTTASGTSSSGAVSSTPLSGSATSLGFSGSFVAGAVGAVGFAMLGAWTVVA